VESTQRDEETQLAKLPKNGLKECVFVNSALKTQCQKTQCHIVKNTLLETAFLGDFTHWGERGFSTVPDVLFCLIDF